MILFMYGKLNILQKQDHPIIFNNNLETLRCFLQMSIPTIGHLINLLLFHPLSIVAKKTL